jgi:hypothetical protein
VSRNCHNVFWSFATCGAHANLTCIDGSLYTPSIYHHASLAASRLAASIHVLHVIERDEAHGPHDLTGSIGFDANAGLLEELAKHDESHARFAGMRGKAILQDAAKQLPGHEVKITQRHGCLWPLPRAPVDPRQHNDRSHPHLPRADDAFSLIPCRAMRKRKGCRKIRNASDSPMQSMSQRAAEFRPFVKDCV